MIPGKIDTIEKKESTPRNLKEREKFFGKSLASLLGQWPIKPIRKENNKPENKEPFTPEIESEIKKIFWENHEIIF